MIDIMMAFLYVCILACLLGAMADWNRIERKEEDLRQLPSMHTLLLDGKDKIYLNKERIAAGGKIVEVICGECEPVQGQHLKSSVKFKEITYGELLEKAETQELLFIRFGDLKDNSICFTHFIDRNGNLSEIDYSVALDWISDEYRYCFVCRSCDVPFGMRGKGRYGNFDYWIDAAESGMIYPKPARWKWRKRGK